MEETVSDAVDAYISGFPLVIMDMTRKQVTNVASPEATELITNANRDLTPFR